MQLRIPKRLLYIYAFSFLAFLVVSLTIPHHDDSNTVTPPAWDMRTGLSEEFADTPILAAKNPGERDRINSSDPGTVSDFGNQNFSRFSPNHTKDDRISDTSSYTEDNQSERRAPPQIRSYETVASDGKGLLNLPKPIADRSPEGSNIINHESNGYYIKRRDDKREVNIYSDRFNFLVPLALLGRTIPTLLKEIFIFNNLADPVTGKIPGKIPYKFAISAVEGLVIVKRAYKRDDHGEPKEEHFSEILYRIWYDWAKIQGVSVDSIRYIIHDLIANDETLMVVRKIIEEVDWVVQDVRTPYGGSRNGKEIRLSASSDNEAELTAFRAMIGCPNGKGVIRMLNDHSHALEQKQISQVLIWLPFPEENVPLPYVLYEVVPSQ
ncbi:hypothetical protein TWF694_000311 [Orbilia ellipsospora]|uniref:Uncharacterized protein n=1 Tax=Orbilia ellipsospora TaxID=2528407 RepID=A0AAV9XPS7_9PEZI